MARLPDGPLTPQANVGIRFVLLKIRGGHAEKSSEKNICDPSPQKKDCTFESTAQWPQEEEGGGVI